MEDRRIQSLIRSAGDLVARAVATVVYAGKPGATPSAHIGVLSWEYPPYEGGLVYLVDGQDRHGQSTSAVLQCESVRRSAERIEGKMRSSPIARLFPATRPETSAERAASNLLQKMGFWPRAALPETFGADLVAETIRTGALTAICGTRFDGPTIDRPRLDARVISYDRYSGAESLLIGLSTERSPAWNALKEKAWRLTKSSDALQATYPTRGDDVLIACGAAWDVRYAAELVPGVVLDRYVHSVAATLPQRAGAREDLSAIASYLPNTVAHYAAQYLVREADIGIAQDRANIPNAEDQHAGLEQVGLNVYYETSRDLEVYKRIADHPDVHKAGLGEKQAVCALDAMRPHLRQFGIFDTNTMEEHASLIRDAIVKDYQVGQNGEALEHGAVAVRKHITARREADLQAKIAQSEAEMPIRERMAGLLDRMRAQRPSSVVDHSPEITRTEERPAPSSERGR